MSLHASIMSPSTITSDMKEEDTLGFDFVSLEPDEMDLSSRLSYSKSGTGVPEQPNYRLSELSKQLRMLQSENYDKGNEVERLERKLKIMADLKGVSIGDLKLALHTACEGEAFNELRSQVVTLRNQLALTGDVSSKSPSSAKKIFENAATSNKIINLELRVGELEEVEENLRAEVAKLYKQLRTQTAKATELEAKCEGQRSDIEDLNHKLNDSSVRRDLAKRETDLTEAYSEIERLVAQLSKAQTELRNLRLKIEDLEEESHRTTLLETMCEQQKKKMQEIIATAAKDAKEREDSYRSKLENVMGQFDKLSQQALDGDMQIKEANERIKGYENQLKKLRALEFEREQQKQQMKDLQEKQIREIRNKDDNHKDELTSMKQEMQSLREQLQKSEKEAESEKEFVSQIQAELSSAKQKNADNAKKLIDLRALELKTSQQEELIRAMESNASRAYKEMDEKQKEVSQSVRLEVKSTKDRASRLESELRNERERAMSLEEELLRAEQKITGQLKGLAKLHELQVECDHQKNLLKEIQEETKREVKEKEEAYNEMADSKIEEIRSLTDRAINAELALKHEREQLERLQVNLAKLTDYEDLVSDQKRQLSELTRQHKNELRKLKDSNKETRKAGEAKNQDLVDRIAEHELSQKNDKDRIALLNKRVANLEDLKTANGELVAKLAKMTAKAKSLDQGDKTTKKQIDDAKGKSEELKKRLKDQESKVKIEREKVVTLESQLDNLEKDYKLRKKQHKTRTKVQEDRIQDLEQQLSSLCTAFHIERGDRNVEYKTQTVLQKKLNEADTTVALHTHKEEERTVGAPNTPTTPTRASISSDVTTSTPSTNPQTPSSYIASPAAIRSPLQTYESQGGVDVVCEGYLLKRDNIKGWKRRYFVLTGDTTTNSSFKLTYSDSRGSRVKGTLVGFIPGLTVIVENDDFPRQPHTFVLHVDPMDVKAQVLTAAAETREDMDRWIKALKMTTSIERSSVSGSTTQHPTGSLVVIVDLQNRPEFNGCTGMLIMISRILLLLVTSPHKLCSFFQNRYRQDASKRRKAGYYSRRGAQSEGVSYQFGAIRG